MATKRTSKVIKDNAEIERISKYTRDDITTEVMMSMFGEFNGKVKYNPYDIVTIPTGFYGNDKKKNKTPFTTTIGKWIFNKIFIESKPSIMDAIGWFDDIVNKKAFGRLYDQLGYLRLENKITLEDYIAFCDDTQTVMPYVSILSNSFTDEMLTSSAKINKIKKKLIEENKAALDAGDIKVCDDISKQLLDYSKDILKDDPSMDMFNSGVGGDFDNNFKNMFIMKGASKDPDPAKGYNIITSNYIDGVSVDEYAKLANTLAEGPYNRSKKTEIGGWWEKLFISAFQNISLLPAGSDCGTKRYITYKITEKNIGDIMYCYIIEGDKLVELTSDNKDKYIGKTVKLRFSSLCEAKEGICSKCAGNLWYRLGFTNVGVMTPQIPSRIKNLNMKSFHNSQVNLVEMNPMEAFGLTD